MSTQIELTYSTEAAMSQPKPQKPVAGTPEFWRTARGMFVGGFGTFSMLYCLQPLMPQFSEAFGVTPAHASGVVSAATGTLALGLIPASLLADRYGRKPIMLAAMVLSAILMVACSFASSFNQLLWLRGLMGLILAGLPATGMAYLSEEMDASTLGRVMGMYIAGNALGGMSGRFVAALIVERYSWRVACIVLGAIAVTAAVEFWRSLPPSRHFHPSRVSIQSIWADTALHFRDAGLPWLFVTPFLLMGCFVSVYNYLGYRLAAAPYSLSPGQLGLVFSLYIVGMWSSAAAGKLADKIGRRNVLWMTVCTMTFGLLLTLAQALPLIILGVGLCTLGFFGGHSVASSWVGRRALKARALASAIYLCAYYLGSSVLGSVAGFAWAAGHWSGVVALLFVTQLACMAIAFKLRRLEPLPLPLG